MRAGLKATAAGRWPGLQKGPCVLISRSLKDEKPLSVYAISIGISNSSSDKILFPASYISHAARSTRKFRENCVTLYRTFLNTTLPILFDVYFKKEILFRPIPERGLVGRKEKI